MLILVCNYTYVKIFILNGTNVLINQTGYKTAGWLSSRYQDNLIPFIPLLYSTLFFRPRSPARATKKAAFAA